MPNWCENKLVLWGNNDDVNRVLEFVKGKLDNGTEIALDFNKILPIPDYIYQGTLGQRQREMYGKNNWYDWCIANWNTKWNAFHVEVIDGEIYFDTAWTPATPVIEKLAEMFPNVEFEYFYAECGSDFSGYRCFRNGEQVDESDGDYGDYYGEPWLEDEEE